MKIPLTWLKEYCDPGLSAEEVGERLSLSGTELERIVRVGVPARDGNAGFFRIGKVMSADPHPDADRLSVCAVQLAGSDMRTIVCGAPNVAAGETVLVALPGAVLPDGRKLGRAKLRGVESDGMILSETEVELGADSEGIMVLPDSLEAGEEAGRYVTLGDDVLEFEISPNRPDNMCVYGIARELHAITGAPLAPDPAAEDVAAEASGAAEDLLSVTVTDPELCPRFSVRIFTGVQVGPSPLWLRARLAAVGQRSINNVVDITNYVMLLVGQPMHAYDLDRIAGPAIEVRRARHGERVVTLDGEERVCDSNAVLVCDADGPTGIGGVMGGAASEVSAATTRVAMEAATWNGPNILDTSSKLGLRTEASSRFERQLHPELALAAQRLAARMMVELCGARIVPGTIDVAEPVPAPRRLGLRSARVQGILGEVIDPDESAAILERLGFGVERADAPEGDLDVEVPYFRDADVQREADMIEEVARVHGLDRLPTTLPARERAVGALTRTQKLRRTAVDLLRGRGLTEIINFSFISPSVTAKLRLPAPDDRTRVLMITNPLSEDQSAMRTTLLPGLLGTAQRNVARDRSSLAIFETGRVFLSNGPDVQPEERFHLGVLLAGEFTPKTWRADAKEADFHVVNGLLAGLLEALGVGWRLVDGGPPFLHPGRAAEVLIEARDAGYLGEVHPQVAHDFGLAELARPPAVFEIDLGVALAAAEKKERRFVDLITYPPVYQDIAVVVDEAVEAQTVVDCVRAAGAPELRSVRIFDLYRGEQLAHGKKSLALRLEFQSPDRTLTDEDVAEIRRRIESRLAQEVGGSLRG
jgi:phenylalanyl-tRNA synthetase beta chain